jgi:hypothetical protein
MMFQNSFFCTQVTEFLPGLTFQIFFKRSVTIPVAPPIVRMSINLIILLLFASICKLYYLVIFRFLLRDIYSSLVQTQVSVRILLSLSCF